MSRVEGVGRRPADGASARITPGLDHIALTVPDLDAQVDRLTSAFGFVVESRMEVFAVLSDPVSGLKVELGRSDDAEVHFRHLGFCADDVDGTHDSLVAGGVRSASMPSSIRAHQVPRQCASSRWACHSERKTKG